MRQTAPFFNSEVRMVLRAPPCEPQPCEIDTGGLIAPIERGLGVLAAFRQGDEWLGNQEIAQRTLIPKATVTRLTQTLSFAGFLRHSPLLRKYRLAPAVLTLGFASVRNSDFAAAAQPLVQQFADECGVFATLASRVGLDTVIAGSCHSAARLMTLALNDGARIPIAGSPLGLALLGGLPELEREYLLDSIRQRRPAEYRSTLRQRVLDALEQVRTKGYCTGGWGEEIVVAAAPLAMPERPALVIGCAAPASALPRARLVEFVGPRLAALAGALRGLQPDAAHEKLGHA